MLTIPTKPDDEYLLSIAEHIIKKNATNVRTAMVLIEKVCKKSFTWFLRVRIAKELISKGQYNFASNVISGIDLTEYINRCSAVGEIKILLNLLISLNRWEEVLKMLEYGSISPLLPQTDEFDIRFKVASRLIGNKQTGRAEKLICSVDVEKIYKENLGFKDGFARIGWIKFWPKGHYEKVIHWIEKDLNYSKNSDDAVSFLRLSPKWRINYAQAMAANGDIHGAKQQVRIAYDESSTLAGGYSKVGKAYLKSQNMAYDKLIHYHEKDSHAGRLDGNGKLIYAKALAFVGRVEDAVKCVEDAYQIDWSLKNGYAQIGYISSFILNYKPEKALEWFVLDQNLGRLHGDFLQHMATVHAAVGDVESAALLVDRIYKKDSKAINGYSLIGWYGFMVKRHDPEGALKFFKMDRKLQRMNQRLHNFLGNTGNLLAGVYAFMGNRRNAEHSIPLTGEDNKRIVGGHAIAGFCDYHHNKDFYYLASMLEMEKDTGHFSRPFLSYLYAAVLLRIGEKKEAEKFIHDAAQRSAVAPDSAKAWLKKVAYTEDEIERYFISNELESLFMRHL